MIKERLAEAIKKREGMQPTLPTTLETENQTNPFLRCNEKSVIDSASNYAGRSLDNPVDVFATIRDWKDSF